MKARVARPLRGTAAGRAWHSPGRARSRRARSATLRAAGAQQPHRHLAQGAAVELVEIEDVRPHMSDCSRNRAAAAMAVTGSLANVAS
jgi:hypothetical protein